MPGKYPLRVMRIRITTDRWFSLIACNSECPCRLFVHRSSTAGLDLARMQIAGLMLLDGAYTEWPVLLNWVSCIVLLVNLMESCRAIDTTILGVRRHAKTSDHHTLLNTVACAQMLLLWRKTIDYLVWKNLAESLNVRRKIKILRYLLDPLAYHGSLNNVFRTHRTTAWQSCGTSIVWAEGHCIKWVSRNLWSWCKNLPDLKGTLKLYHLDRLHWIRILAILNTISIPDESFGYPSKYFIQKLTKIFDPHS